MDSVQVNQIKQHAMTIGVTNRLSIQRYEQTQVYRNKYMKNTIRHLRTITALIKENKSWRLNAYLGKLKWRVYG